MNLIMDRVPADRPAGRPYINRTARARTAPNSSFSSAPSRLSRRRRPHKAVANNVPAALRTQAADLRFARTNLDRCYNQEQNVRDISVRCTGVTFDLSDVSAARARAERRYVNCLIRYLRNANQMSGVQAAEMQRTFTRQKMEGVGVNNRAYLLGMYPRELN